MASLPRLPVPAARPRLAAFAALATAAATALTALGSLPVQAQQPAPSAPASLTAPAEAQPQTTRPLHPRAASSQEQVQKQQQQQQTREQRRERWQQRRAERMAAFKAQLQLTPAQETAWTDFTTALQPGQRHARLGRDGMEQLTTPERIDRMRALRLQRAAEADRRGDAVKTFYAALSAPQQSTFDTQMQRLQQHRHPGQHGGKKHRHGSQAQGEGGHAAMHHGHGYGHGYGYGHGHGQKHGHGHGRAQLQQGGLQQMPSAGHGSTGMPVGATALVPVSPDLTAQ